MRGGRAAEIAVILILALGTWLGFATAGLPGVVPASAPPALFSAARTIPDLHAIAVTPHALGSHDHDRVRDYLVDRLRAVGCEDVHVQSATGFNTLDGPLAATVANVVCRKLGLHPGRAVLLSAHYDAVPRSFGAGDDGAGVVAILETLRALSADPPLDNDLIITFVDAEEEGLLGTEAFVNLHPWARSVAVVLNFDARGDRGPVYMFQTSPGNTRLIQALARVGSTRTNSLTGEVYRHLPSDTDMSIWLHSRFAVGALNFANVDGYTHYHTPSDNETSLDLRVVQQMGDYALSLTRTFGHGELVALRTTDAIYFNAPLVGVIHYPASWALILAIDGFALALVLVGLCRTRQLISLPGVGRGAAGLAATLILSTVITLAAWRVILLIHPSYREILQRDPYNSKSYLVAAFAFTVAVWLAVQQRLAGRVTPLEGVVAPILLWGVLGLVIARALPGASYLFAWPLFAATLSISWWRRATLKGKLPGAWLALLAIPIIVLWPPLIAVLETGLTINVLPGCALLLALALSMLTLPLELAGDLRRHAAKFALAVAACALIVAEVQSSFSAERKRPDSLAYLVDADSNRAWWASFDRTVDQWTLPALGTHPSRRAFGEFNIDRGAATLLAAAAVPPPPSASPVTLVHDDSVSGSHRIHLHIAGSGNGEALAISVDSSVGVSGMTINGRVLQDGGDDRYSPRYHVASDGTILRYFGVPEEGVDLQFTVHVAAPTRLRVVTAVEGLPPTATGPLGDRPMTLMSKPFVPTDMTLTKWTITIPGSQ